jgi:hypothetical protein
LRNPEHQDGRDDGNDNDVDIVDDVNDDVIVNADADFGLDCFACAPFAILRGRPRPRVGGIVAIVQLQLQLLLLSLLLILPQPSSCFPAANGHFNLIFY